MVEIQSAGPPPERHADRVVGEMLRMLAAVHIGIDSLIHRAWANSSDGSPRAQEKLRRRMQDAGAQAVWLTPGKRGRYTLRYMDFIGWNPNTDTPIEAGDPVPDRPWLACCINTITSEGHGRNRSSAGSKVLVLITHHAFSRFVQRCGARTIYELWDFLPDLVETICGAIRDRRFAGEPPLAGWHLPLATAPGVVVLKRDPARKNKLVVLTVEPVDKMTENM